MVGWGRTLQDACLSSNYTKIQETEEDAVFVVRMIVVVEQAKNGEEEEWILKTLYKSKIRACKMAYHKIFMGRDRLFPFYPKYE